MIFGCVFEVFCGGIGTSWCWPPSLCQGYVQLNQTLCADAQKFDLPTNRGGYNRYETTVGNLSKRRINWCCEYFFCFFWQKIFFQSGFKGSIGCVLSLKLQYQGLGSFVNVFVCWKIVLSKVQLACVCSKLCQSCAHAETKCK